MQWKGSESQFPSSLLPPTSTDSPLAAGCNLVGALFAAGGGKDGANEAIMAPRAENTKINVTNEPYSCTYTKITPGGSSLDNIFALLPCCQRKICRFYQSTVLLRFHWRVLITSPSGHFVLDGRESRLFVFQISPLRHLRLSTCFQTSVWPFFLELSFPFCYNW